jgi:hypothetical protein
MMAQKTSTYQGLAIPELQRVAAKYGDNPLTTNAFKILAENPLWLRAFNDKPVDVDLTYFRQIADEAQLSKWSVPREYSAVEVEREYIIDLRGNVALIERVYFVTPHRPYTGEERKLVAVTTVSRDYRYQRNQSRQLNIVTSRPESIYPKAQLVKGVDPLIFLEQKDPLSLS